MQKSNEDNSKTNPELLRKPFFRRGVDVSPGRNERFQRFALTDCDILDRLG